MGHNVSVLPVAQRSMHSRPAACAAGAGGDDDAGPGEKRSFPSRILGGVGARPPRRGDRMHRRTLLGLIGGAIGAAATAPAQAKAMPVVGLLASHFVFDSGFTEGLSKAGYSKGRNVRFEEESAYDQYDRLPKMAADLARRVDVIAAFGVPEAQAARRASATIPIVFLATDDPVEEGFTTSLAHPSANLTGVLMLDDALMPKRLDLLSQLVPQAKAFGLMVNPMATSTPAVIHTTQRAARARGVDLHVLNAGTDAEMQAAFAVLRQMKLEGVIIDDGDTGVLVQTVDGTGLRLAARDAVPAIYSRSVIPQLGGLISYGPDRLAARRQMGFYVGKILGGAKPADLPFARPDKIDLVINLKTAGALGLRVPSSLLAQADKLIK